ncbi:MAG: hypothetical protein UFX20_03810 [Longibaculum muris]|uniref:Uncharacterized protein n=2 Tax=Longibaculum muris TaxID=1796628 RepID=A0A4R3Z377_9FIRM|nr:hypothetical protein [Longibaculum muris]KXU42415.1 hypothetical protein HMPREF3037_02867 [Candidatus Stoquefichus sp. KLE1796]MBS5368727.1 hypothetical protein [Coprobacillus cateniformis]MCR1888739.1 hypothetical protein [Longibaculum muris]MED9811213.1 hypothetical protein [Longibaculum muris]TCV99583.1 hypothetical protein EDD60_10822 [Longibaculum muris]
MEVGLIILLFVSNALALDCLYNHRIKTTGALLILNLCLTVALAYQFKQMEKIVYILLGLIGVIVLFFGVRFYIKKKKEAPIIIEDADRIIEEKEEK